MVKTKQNITPEAFYTVQLNIIQSISIDKY